MTDTIKQAVATLKVKVADLFTLGIPGIQRVKLRGGQIVEVDWFTIAREGFIKILTYGLGRYLRDGAQSTADLPYHEIPREWNDMDRQSVMDWMLNNGGETVTDSLDSVTHIRIDAPTSKRWLKLDRIPGFENPQEFRIWFTTTLNTNAFEHYKLRYGHLQSGQIPEGRGRTATLSPFEQTFRRKAQDIARQFGWSRKEDGDIPLNLEDAKALFIRLGCSNANHPDAGEYFDAFVKHCYNITAQEQNDF